MPANHSTLSTRQKSAGENHHLWDNHGGWWFHGTEHRPDGTSARIRINLRTRNVTDARSKRDRILAICTKAKPSNP